MINQSDLQNYFAYLDALRISGVTNMFGSGAYLQEEFDLQRKQASQVVGLWMRTFSDKPASVRAADAIAINKGAIT